MEGQSVETSGLRRSMKRLARRQAAALSLAGLLFFVVTAAALAATGDITQPAGAAGCVSETGAGNCADGHALNGANGVAVSGDAKNVYATSYVGNAVVRLNRNTTTGAISQPAGSAGCVSQTGAGPCADGHALDSPFDVAVSPGGKSVYVASSESDAVVRLNRNATTGAITQPAGIPGCVSNTEAEDCGLGHALDLPASVAVSPGGKNVYVASFLSKAVAILNRDTSTGAITQPTGTAGCVSETGSGPCADGRALGEPASVAVSSDGKSVYVASLSNAVARFNRNTTTGALSQPAGTAGCVSEDGTGPCADGHALLSAFGVAVKGNSVYVTSQSWSAVARLNRNTTTGAISQPPGTDGCVSETGAGGCTDGHAFGNPLGVTVSPDGKSVYVASYTAPFGGPGGAVVRLNRNTTTGAIAQPAGTAGCVNEDGTGPCADGHALLAPADVAVSPDAKSVYVASPGSSAVVRLNRGTITGAIAQPAGTSGCVSETGAGGCADGHGLDGPGFGGPFGVAVSANGKSVYVVSQSRNSVVRFNRAP
jgi:DNA-binding beta-propeller fold protein YncE